MAGTSSKQLRITLLGAPKIERGGDPVSLPRRRTRALLYFLSASPGPHGRDELADLLWPNLTSAKGRRQLTDALSDLRRTLGAEVVESDAERVALAASNCDATEFVAAVEEFGDLSAGDGEARLSKALELYGGEFLSGVRIDGSEAFEEWVQDQRQSLSAVALGA